MIKLTLNYDALNTLIKESGDEFKVELKSAIIKSAINHAFALITEQERDNILARIRNLMEAEVNKERYSFNDIQFTPKFNNKVTEAFKRHAERLFDDILNSFIDNKMLIFKDIEFKEINKIVESKLEKFKKIADSYIDEKMDTAMIEYINHRINTKLKEKCE